MKLKDIVELTVGYSFRTKIKNDPEGDTKVIQMSDVDKYQGIMIDQLDSVLGFDPRSDKYFLNEGDIIMVSKGYNINAYVMPECIGKVVAVNSFIVMKPKISGVIPAYIAWFLNSKRTQYFFSQMAAGTNVPNLSIKALEAVELGLPTIEQQQVVAELERLKQKEISLYQAISEKKEVLIDELLQRQVDKWKSN